MSAAVDRYGPNALTLLRELSEIDYSLAERNYAHFFRAAWSVLEPSTPLLWNWHNDLVAEYLQATLTGDIKRLIINIPPRYAKSLEVTVAFPAWCWIAEPSLRFITASYAEDLAVKHSVDRRLLMAGDWYQAAWGDRFAFSADQNQKAEYTNNKRGHCKAVGMLGAVTGSGGDYVIIDDPHNPKKAESDLERTAAIEAFDSAFTTRLDNKRTGRMIVVMQRLHHKDLTGHLLEKGGWTHLKVPVDAPTRVIIKYPVSGKVKVREKGELLHPQREGKKELAAAKIALGTYNYAGQYDQDPSPRAGGLFKLAYWRYYDPTRGGGGGQPPRFDDVIQSWDLSFKDQDQAKGDKAPDPVVGIVMARLGADIYVLDLVEGVWGLTASQNALRRLTAKWPAAHAKLLEDKANGPGVQDSLRREIQGIKLESVEGSKWERACLCEPTLEARNVHLPHPEKAPWVSAFISQCSKFPRGAHDDQVDAFTQGLNYLRRKTSDRIKALGKY